MIRVTKIICPHCEGTGALNEHAGRPPRLIRRSQCHVCNGYGRVRPADARQYADNLYTCAVGGYAVGDHDQKEKDRLTTKAMAVFRLLGEMPPWLRTVE